MWNENHGFMNIGASPNLSVHNLGLIPLVKERLKSGNGHISEMMERGNISVTEGKKPFFDKIEELGGKLFYKLIGIEDNCIFMWEDGIVELSFAYNGSYVTVSGLSKNEKLITELQEFSSKRFIKPVKTGHVFAIVKQGNNLLLSSLGNAGIKLNKNNYTAEVVADYNYIVDDLRSKSPSGRIVILEGQPGSGKTHIVRSLLTEVPNGMFVLIAPEMVTSLSGPELLPLLLSNKQGYASSGPIILILEDADKCLVSRGSDNINSIQALLNLGDGILGSMLDIRIVATTNAKKMEMEAAILRPGRLSKRVEVGALDLATSRKVFSSLLPETAMPADLLVKDNQNAKFTLAELYFMARKHGWKVEDSYKSNPQELTDDDYYDEEDYSDDE